MPTTPTSRNKRTLNTTCSIRVAALAVESSRVVLSCILFVRHYNLYCFGAPMPFHCSCRPTQLDDVGYAAAAAAAVVVVVEYTPLFEMCLLCVG